MNNSQDPEDSDPQGATPNSGKKSQRQRGRMSTPNHFRPPLFSCNGDSDFLPPPSDCHQRQQHSHPHNGKPPLAQWQYFMRHQPFGDSARLHQFPPPPHFPQFQFGTFPGRSSPRIHPRRENLVTSMGNNAPSDGHLNKSRDTPKDARPKTSFGNVNGRKKYYKKKHSHDTARNNKMKKDCLVKETNGQMVTPCADTEELIVMSSTDTKDYREYCSFNGNSAFGTDDDGEDMRVSKSCDGSWLNETPVSFLSGRDTPPAEEGAVGGVPAPGTASETLYDKNESCNYSDKDLIDEGAIFDLDNIFQNREHSKKSDDNFYSNSDSGDDLDLVLGLQNNAMSNEVVSSSDELDNGTVGRRLSSPSGYNTKSVCNQSHKNKSCTQCSLKELGCEINQSNVALCILNGHRNDLSDSRDSQESDGGEDTGDFIDTDLPSHTKHILSSSSDEMDNASSAKESDEEDCMNGSCYSRNDKKYNSDFNSNDLSTLEPNVVNGIHHLRMQGTECECAGSVLPNRRHNNNHTLYVSDSFKCNCDSESRPLPAFNSSSVKRNSDEGIGYDHVKCNDSHHNNIPRPISHFSIFKTDSSSHSSIHGAAADIVPPRPNISPFPGPPGADSEVYNSGVSPGGGPQVRPWTEHCSLPASGGHCFDQPSIGVSASGSGTSAGEEGAGCCAHQQYQSPSQGHNDNSHNLAHTANGFNECDINPSLMVEESSTQHPHSSTGDNFENQAAISSASSAGQEKPLEMNVDLPDRNAKEVDPMSGFEDDLLSLDSSGDHIDTVLLPMEEDIEPVYSMDAGHCAGQAIFDVMEEEFGDIVSHPDFESSSSSNVSQAIAIARYEEGSRPPPRDPMSSGNRLPSKEFYELIKRVSATDSYMQFFDKDGQDVQRSTPKSVNEEEEPGKVKRESGKSSSSGSKTDCLKVDRVMIWNEYEAYVVQYKQIAVSACGQTAVLNVLKALKFQCEKSLVCKVIQTNLRKEDKDIPHYLFSRACAGTTAAELMSGVSKLTGGVIGGRFFHFWPPRKVKLLQWLAYWMKRGAIPMATLNLQQGPHSVWEVPDSWHHQMVYGVSHQGLYLTNPLEIVSERSAIKQLCSDSVLLVRRQDIVSRFRESTDLGQLLDHPDPRWMSMNVLGQVVNVLRECNMPSVPGYRVQVTSHVRIPALYEAGITLFMRKDKPDWNALVTASELPLA